MPAPPSRAQTDAKNASVASKSKSNGGNTSSQFNNNTTSPTRTSNSTGGYTSNQFGNNITSPSKSSVNTIGRGTGGLLGSGNSNLAARIGAISRGPGLSDVTGYQKAISAVTAYPETPSGLLDPNFNRRLNSAAVNRQSLFNLNGGTPEQNALVNRIGPDALLASGRYGVDARTLMGQALTESTTGRNPTRVSKLASDANNLFGMKATGKPNEFWDGSTLNLPTKEVLGGKTVNVDAPFRSYDTPEQSVYDYGRLMGTPRYANALAGKTSVQDQLGAIRGAGYATHDPSDYTRMAMGNVDNLQIGGTSQTPTQTASINPAGAPQQQRSMSETGPSTWEQLSPQGLQDAVATGAENLTALDQFVKKVGPERAVKLAKAATAIMNFMPKGDGVPNVKTGEGTGGEISVWGRPAQTAQQQNGAKAKPAPLVNQAEPPTPQSMPWLYPEYSQQWAGLPTGVGGQIWQPPPSPPGMFDTDKNVNKRKTLPSYTGVWG